MRQRHLRPQLPAHAHALRRKDEQRGRAVGLGMPGDARGFEAAVGINAGDDRQPVAELIHREAHDLALLVEGAGVHLQEWPLTVSAEMPGDSGDIAQVLSIGGRIDREIGV